MEIDPEAIALIGIFLGVLLRTILPALRKWKDFDDFEWSNKYTATMIISIITAVAVAIIAFPQFIIPVTSNPYTIFSAAFICGIGLNELVIEVTEWVT